MTESIPSDRHSADDDLGDAGDDESQSTDRGDGKDRVDDATERAEDDATSVDQIIVGHKVSDAVEDGAPGDPDKDGH